MVSGDAWRLEVRHILPCKRVPRTVTENWSLYGHQAADFTCITDGEAGKFAGGAVKIAAAVDEDLNEAGRSDGLVEKCVVAAQIADEVACARAHFALPVFQQRAHMLHQPCLQPQPSSVTESSNSWSDP